MGLPVKFHVGVSSRDVEDVLHATLVQWHLTGVGLVPGQDPASEEHFGISVAEGGGGVALRLRLRLPAWGLQHPAAVQGRASGLRPSACSCHSMRGVAAGSVRVPAVEWGGPMPAGWEAGVRLLAPPQGYQLHATLLCGVGIMRCMLPHPPLSASTSPAAAPHLAHTAMGCMGPRAGMSAGCIPVVLLRGGVGDIVQHGVNGFLGPEIPQLANLTLQVFNMNLTQQAALRTRAIRDVMRWVHGDFA